MKNEDTPDQHVRIPEEIPRQARDDGQREISPPGASLNSVVQRATRGRKVQHPQLVIATVDSQHAHWREGSHAV